MRPMLTGAVAVAFLLATALAPSRAWATRYVEMTILNATVITATGQYPPSGQGSIDTFNGDDQRDAGSAVFYIDLTAVGGTTPSFTLFIFGVMPSGKNYTIAQTAAQTANNRLILTVANCPRYVILSYSVSGTTPTFTTTIEMSRF